MANSKEIRRRIKSIKNIGQITKAMELVSAAKMRKAQQQALASRPYYKLSSELLENLSSKVDKKLHPLLQRVLPARHASDKAFEQGVAGGPEETEASDKVLMILVSPNKGLAGALNTNLVNKAMETIRAEGKEKVSFITIGKKGEDLVKRMKFNVVADFASKERDLTILDARPIAQIAMEGYLANNYSKVFIVYTDFITTLTQKPNILQLLPLSKISDPDAQDFLFEPNADEVLESLIQRTVEFAVFQTLVEAQASEHSARMVAMRNANEASSDLISDLELSYNQARQAGITRELSEISAAKLAMEN
jgi:F-type H+-transporting ATPase subunit gamma